MSYAPRTLLALRSFLIGETGLPDVSLGIVGDSRHASGYHCGRDRIYSSAGLGDRDYSIRLSRDKAGLTNAASAIDIGNFPGLRSLSVWLVGQCQANASDTRDIREVIYSPDGVAVRRWDNHAKRLYVGGDGTGQGDNSHRTHTHISYFRDSEDRAKVAPFQRFFDPAGPLPDTSTEPEMQITKRVRERWHPTVGTQSNGVLRKAADRSAPFFIRLPANEHIVTIAEVRTVDGPDGNFRLVEWPGTEPVFALRGDWESDGFLPDDCSAAVADAVAPLNAKIAAAKAALG